MHRVLWMALPALLVIAGCRRAPGPIDPGDTTRLPACPAGPHLVVGVQSRSTDADQLVLRYAGASLEECQGVVVPSQEYDTLTTVGGLPDGTDLVGFAEYYGGGRLVRFDGATEVGRVEDASSYPIGIAPVTLQGQAAIAVVWGGDSSGSSDSGDRVEIYAQGDLSSLGRWDVSSSLTRVAAAPSGQPDRIAAVIDYGIQEYRADPSATSLPTTGELQIAKPRTLGYLRSLDVSGQLARAGSDKGVLSWRLGESNALLGPVACTWPATTDTLLPAEEAHYAAAVIDLAEPDDTLVVVEGDVEGVDASTHLYLVHRRGECERLVSYPTDYAAVAIAWAGR